MTGTITDEPATVKRLDTEVMKAYCPYCGKQNTQVWVYTMGDGGPIAEKTCEHFVHFAGIGNNELEARFEWKPSS